MTRIRGWGRVAGRAAIGMLVGAAGLAGAPSLQAREDTIVITADGRTISAPPSFAAGQRIRISLPRRETVGCPAKRPEAGAFMVSYRFAELSEQPDVLLLTDDPKWADDKGGGVFEIAGPATGDRLLVYNVLEGSADVTALPALEHCLADVKQAAAELAGLKKLVDDARTRSEAAAAAVAARKRRIAGLNDDVHAFQPVTVQRSAEEIAQILAAVGKEREALIADEAAAAQAEDELAAATSDLQDAVAAKGSSLAELTARGRRLSAYIDEKKKNPDYVEAVVLKVGGAVVGNVRAVNYDLGNREAADVITIAPMGPYPVVRYGERLALALLNIVDTRFPYPFALQATAQAGVVINLSPVRPVFEPNQVSLAGAAKGTHGLTPAANSRLIRAERVYRDLFFPVVGTFAPNDLAEVTLSTERLDGDGKRTEVKLLDKARLPPFRARYRFNFNTGVVSTSLRQPTFQKVLVTPDDPATDKEVEARYRTSTLPGDRRVLPVFAFTVYFVPVDVQGPVTWGERAWPNPTVGFAFADPADDVFLGFSHEVARNLQLFYGLHFGKVNELVARNDVTEDRDGTAPVTREKRDKAFVFGITLNVNVVKQIFK